MSDVQRLEVLDRIDCLLLLSSQSLGRVVFTAHALPACQPVAFLLDGERVLFRAVDGSTLSDAAGGGNIVAVHVDNAHQGQTSFWSVTVVGCCQIITDAGDIAALTALPVMAHPPNGDDQFVSVDMAVVRGWRFLDGCGIPLARRDGRFDRELRR